MRGKAASIAILSVFGFLAWADIASAIPPIVPNPNRDQLEGYCNENGGIFLPPAQMASMHACCPTAPSSPAVAQYQFACKLGNLPKTISSISDRSSPR
jgi:hypothetical protein